MTGVTAVGQRADVLELDRVTVGYGRSTVLRDVTLTVPAGSVVALLGPNGAGKTTMLRTAAGQLYPSAGTVALEGTEVTHQSPHERARAGLCLIPEGRGVFPRLTVWDNLALQVPPWRRGEGIEPALDAFPALRARLKQTAGTMSGGQQQMLALARCYLAKPAVVLLDEVSMGLAPRIIDQIFDALHTLATQGVAMLLVEQYVSRALDLADQIYLLDRGTISFSGPPAELDQDSLLRGYLTGDGNTKSRG
ncbi:ABC transporter related [Parafrankia sp. EAN1pec]|uniref:ABC transporter ATP-binding protein n=1 Tax=Parafrankia sp. (strain EAN1pec) TaxID=298653 RepID=UPI000054305B|nr:ABC transporter related [Frankia sp. EAN1pec]